MRIIGLGHNCAVALMLRKLLTPTAFDNMITKNPRTLADVLNSKGTGLFLPQNVEWLPHKLNQSAIDTKHGIVSVHDIPLRQNKQSGLTKMRNEKLKMIGDLTTLIENCPEKILFIRSNHVSVKLEDTIYLYDTLRALRQDKEFHLCVYQDHQHADLKLGIDSLTMYRTTTPVFQTKYWYYPPGWAVCVKHMCVEHQIEVDLRQFSEMIKLI